jgi:DNA-binding transcriptional ArsR family regulator
MDEVFRAIADPTRRAILDELVDRDGQSLFEICSRLTMKHGINSSRQAISQHLEVLEAAGLVESRRVETAHSMRAVSARWRRAA